MEKLFLKHFSKILEKQPLLKKNKLAIMTNSKSIGQIAHYNISDSKLELAELSKETKRKTDVSNHLIWVNQDKEKFEKHINLVLKDENIDGLICIVKACEIKSSQSSLLQNSSST